MGLLEFIENKNALVVDDQRVNRNAAKAALIELGFSQKRILIEKSISHAKASIDKLKPYIILTEYQIHDDFGLDLALMQREYVQDTDQKMFIVFTNSAEECAVADAAEEEIDAFILKPATEEKIIEYITRIVRQKINPSEYSSMLKQTKAALERKDFEKVLSFSAMAKFMADSPAMAHYYSGEAYRHKQKYDEALNSFNEGLRLKNHHYKCMTGNFYVYKDLKKVDEAYRAIAEIAKLFPLTPSLLRDAFILSIETINYKEVEHFFEKYLRQPRKPPELKHVVSHALLTGGKLLLKDGNIDKALDYLKRGAIISGRQTDYLSNVVKTLTDRKLTKECREFLAMFSHDEVSKDAIESARFRLQVQSEPDLDQVLRRARELIFAGIEDQYIFTTACELSVKLNQTKLLESIVYKAIAVFPEQRAVFVKYIDGK